MSSRRCREHRGGKIAARDLAHREHSLWRVGLGGARKLAVADVHDLLGAGRQGRRERCAADRLGELGREERTTNPEWRSNELLDRTDPFGDEQQIALTSLPAPEVARQGQQLHRFTADVVGIGLPNSRVALSLQQ